MTSSSARVNRTVPHSASPARTHYCPVDAVVFPLSLAYNVSAEMASLKQFPNFRFFMTGRSVASSPQFDIPANASCDANSPTNCNRWLTAAEVSQSQNSNAESFLETFSAVCFMTVRDIAQMHIKHRPVALIQSAWGGTRVEAWMSSAAIAAAGSSSKDVPGRSGLNSASVLYNAMVAPWNTFAVRAAIWYQV